MPRAKTATENVSLYVNHPYVEQIDMVYYPNSHAYKINGDKKIGVTTITGVIEKEALSFYKMSEALKFVKRAFIPMMDGKVITPETEEELDKMLKEAFSAHNVKSQRGKDTGTLVHSWLEELMVAETNKTARPVIPEKVRLPEMHDVDENKELLYVNNPYAWVSDKEIAEETNSLVDALTQFMEWWDEHEIEVVDFERIIYSQRYDYSGRFDAILRIDGKLYLVDFKTNNPSQQYPKGIYPEVWCQIGGYDVAYTQEFYPELDKENKSPFDGYLCLNFSKKSKKFHREYSFDVKVNRAWFVHTLGTKRGMQHHIRNMSMMYAENRPDRKKKAVKK